MKVVSTAAYLPYGLEKIGEDTFDLHIPDLSPESSDAQLYKRVQEIAPKRYPNADFVYIHMPCFRYRERMVNVHIITYRRTSPVQG